MHKAAHILFVILGFCLFVGGALYLVVDEFMPYHATAVRTEWSEVDSNYQALILGLMKGLGAGGFAVGIAVIYMAIVSLLRGGTAFRTVLPLTASSYCLLLSYATWTVRAGTPASPPLELTGLYTLIAIIGWVLLARCAREPNPPGHDG